MAAQPQPSCCPREMEPAGIAGELGATAPLRGQEILIDGKIRAYVSEPPASKLGDDGKPKAAVLLFYDMFGYNSARTHHVCDEIAAEGYLVVEADYFGDTRVSKGSDFLSFKFFSKVSALTSRTRLPYPVVEKIVMEHVLPFIRSKTSGKIGAVGFCWGGWVLTRLASKPDILACGVSPHPSVHLQLLSKEGPNMKGMFDQVKIPLLYCPSRSDPSSLYEDGYYTKILKAKNNGSRSILFADQIHGFANRSDLRIPKNQQAYNKLMREMLQFLDEHLNGNATAPAAAASSPAQ